MVIFIKSDKVKCMQDNCNRDSYLFKKAIILFIYFCLLMPAINSCTNSATIKARGISIEELSDSDDSIAVITQLGHSGSIDSVSYSPDGRYIASGSADASIKLWDAASGRLIRTFIGHSGNITAITFSPNGKYLASASWDRTIKMWDVASDKEITTFTGHSRIITSVAFSPDGNTIVSGSWDMTVRQWDVASGKEIKVLNGHSRTVNSVTYSSDGKTIISGSSDSTIKIWDANTGMVITTLTAYLGEITAVAYSTDNKFIISGSTRNTIKLWETSTGKEINTFSGHTNTIKSISVHPYGNYFISCSYDKTIKLWNLQSGTLIKSFNGHSDVITSIIYSPDGTMFVSGSHDNTIRLWSIDTGNEIRTFSGFSHRINSIAYSPDGKIIASGSDDSTLKLWNTSTGQVINSFIGHSQKVNSVIFNSDGTIIFSSSDDGSIKMWDIVYGLELKTFGNKSDNTSCIALSPDEKIIASCSYDGTIKLWDVASGSKISTFSGHSITGHTTIIYSITYSPDGKTIATGAGDRTVKIWDIATGKEIKTFIHAGMVTYVQFSPDGKILASAGSGDGVIKLWDTVTGKEIRTLSGHSYESFIMWVTASFSSDGNTLASGSDDNTIKLWNITNGRLINTFSGHFDAIESIIYSPDGKKIASASRDGTICLWNITNGKEIVKFISFSGIDNQLSAATRGLTVESNNAIESIDNEWISITPDGYFNASSCGDRYLNVRIGNTISSIDSYRLIFDNPEVVEARLRGLPDPFSKKDYTLKEIVTEAPPPQVIIRSPANFSTINTDSIDLSISITSHNQTIKTIRIFVNGYPIGEDALKFNLDDGLHVDRTIIMVTDNRNSIDLNISINLESGRNFIEVIAHNGLTESRRLSPLIVNCIIPAGRQLTLPNLWIFAVGINHYNNAPFFDKMENLAFASADAKAFINILKTQEGKNYAKVNSLLIADGERLIPTKENIMKNFSFIEQAGSRDTILIFLAGHGLSAQDRKFFFLPRDGIINGNIDNPIVDERYALSGDEISAFLEGHGRRLLFIDACNSAAVDNDRLVRILQESHAFVFSASQGKGFSSYEHPMWGGGHGVFTYSILNALGGDPAALIKPENEISVLSLSGFVREDVYQRTINQQPPQRPQIHSRLFGDFSLATIR